AEAMGTHRVYTPALVIAGATDVVGSDRAGIAKRVAAAPAQRAIPAHAARDGARVTITATAPADADAWVALWQDGAVTEVTRGENQGERLTSDRIVRRFERVALAGHDGSITLAIDPAWTHVGAAVLAQRADKAIVGATVLALE
ncbi:MAG: DUF1223 domain-containing protein, partial [Deltaproteobacteria bacterium]|nr:DUF1223 domain-containing protein [Deltaproteobacteria bacterium]